MYSFLQRPILRIFNTSIFLVLNTLLFQLYVLSDLLHFFMIYLMKFLFRLWLTVDSWHYRGRRVKPVVTNK